MEKLQSLFKGRSLLWIARVWSLPAIIFMAAEIFFPHPGDAPVPWADWLLLASMVAGVFGLLLAWWKQSAGGAIAVAAYLLHIALWPIVRDGFAPTWWLLLVFVAGPGILFFYHGRQSKILQK